MIKEFLNFCWNTTYPSYCTWPYKYMWISAGPIQLYLRAARRKEGRGGTSRGWGREGRIRQVFQTWRQIDAYAFSSTNIIGQWIFTRPELWVGHYKIAFFELYSDDQVQLKHSLTRTSSVDTYKRRLIGYTQLTLSSVLWTLKPKPNNFPHDFAAAF